MRQFVEWFGFPSILTWSTDIFRSILDLSMSVFFFVPSTSLLGAGGVSSLLPMLDSSEPRLLISR